MRKKAREKMVRRVWLMDEMDEEEGEGGRENERKRKRREGKRREVVRRAEVQEQEEKAEVRKPVQEDMNGILDLIPEEYKKPQK